MIHEIWTRGDLPQVMSCKNARIYWVSLDKVHDEVFCGGQSVVHLTNSPTYQNGTSASVYKTGY
jgi:hypothetical protein